MSKKSTYVLGILLAILICSIGHWLMCCKCDDQSECCNKDTATETVEVQKNLSKNGFSVSSDAGSGLDYSVNENFNFRTSGADILQPLATSVTAGISQVKSFLDANPNQMLSIVGHYGAAEQNNTAFPDLGLARANAVKNYFVSSGVLSKNLSTSSKMDDDQSTLADTVLGPVSFVMVAASEAQTDWEALGSKIRANPLVLQFQTAQASISLSADQRQQVADIANYLDHVDGAKCAAIGHTDNDGSRAANTKLGAERAAFAKNYLVSNGISADAIEVSSKGPDEPVADNSTAAGRAINRRTVITIK